ncbi:MAG: hypothetical protein AB7V61_12765 [Methylocystis sp.]
MRELMCRREAAAVAKTLAFRDKVRVEIALDDFCFFVHHALIEDDDWRRDDAIEFVRDLREFIEKRVAKIEAIYLPARDAR